jgi:hypothetical protein
MVEFTCRQHRIEVTAWSNACDCTVEETGCADDMSSTAEESTWQHARCDVAATTKSLCSKLEATWQQRSGRYANCSNAPCRLLEGTRLPARTHHAACSMAPCSMLERTVQHGASHLTAWCKSFALAHIRLAPSAHVTSTSAWVICTSRPGDRTVRGEHFHWFSPNEASLLESGTRKGLRVPATAEATRRKSPFADRDDARGRRFITRALRLARSEPIPPQLPGPRWLARCAHSLGRVVRR